MNNKILWISLVLFVTLSFIACRGEDPEVVTHDCTNLTPTYTSDIKAIMDGNCLGSGCHNSSSRANGIDLSSYAAVSAEADKAQFRGSIEHLSGYDKMPRNSGKLATTQLQKIYCWIESGKPQ